MQPSDSTHSLVQKREEWTKPVEFLFFAISMSVGLGNIWRFPFTSYENGGGAFLIPYIIVLFLVGRPLYFMEVCMGQFSQSECVRVWEISPAFRGIGFAQCFAVWCSLTYLTSIAATTLFYFFSSFNDPLPWSKCPQNMSNCIDASTNLSQISSINNTISSSEIYYQNEVLKMNPDGLADGIQAPDWRLALCLLVYWLTIYLILFKGIKSSGKVSYFLAIFPYIVLIILLIRGATLPGAAAGIYHFLWPNWYKIFDAKVWYSAASQCFYSLGCGYGQLVLISSHNNFRRNIYRDTVILSITDTLTSLLAGLAVFSVLGHLSELMGSEMSDVIKGGGASIAFISYPDVLSRFTFIPQVFSVLFFSMLFTIGMGSTSSMLLSLEEVFSNHLQYFTKEKVRLVLHIVGFLTSLVYVTPQGQHILVLVDFYGASSSVIIMSFVQVIAVMWVYGYADFSKDVQFMLGRQIGLYWSICWKYLAPIFLFSVFIGYLALLEPLKFGNYVFGTGANVFGILLVLIPVTFLPICFLQAARSNKEGHTWMEAVQMSFRATEDWSPKDESIRKKYKEFVRD